MQLSSGTKKLLLFLIGMNIIGSLLALISMLLIGPVSLHGFMNEFRKKFEDAV